MHVQTLHEAERGFYHFLYVQTLHYLITLILILALPFTPFLVYPEGPLIIQYNSIQFQWMKTTALAPYPAPEKIVSVLRGPAL